MEITPAKLASLAIAMCCAIALIVGMGLKNAGGVVLLIVPLGLIWFPEELGSFTGYVSGATINTETPPAVVSGLGWVFLLLLSVMAVAMIFGD